MKQTASAPIMIRQVSGWCRRISTATHLHSSRNVLEQRAMVSMLNFCPPDTSACMGRAHPIRICSLIAVIVRHWPIRHRHLAPSPGEYDVLRLFCGVLIATGLLESLAVMCTCVHVFCVPALLLSLSNASVHNLACPVGMSDNLGFFRCLLMISAMLAAYSHPF